MSTPPSLASSGQRLTLRLLGAASSLPFMDRPDVRATVEKLLYNGTSRTVKAQQAAGRAFKAVRGTGAPVRLEPSAPPALFDLTPTEDQQTLQQVARELADEVLRPAAAAADVSRSVPEDVQRAAADMGLALLGVPAELDGIAEQRSAVTSVLVMEELARGDLGLAVGIMGPAAVATALAAYGNSDQQRTFLPHFTGDDPVSAAAFAVLEPHPLFDALDLRTTASAEGSELVLDGVKALVPRAADAELFVVGVMLEGEPRLVLVPANAGVQIEDDPAMGVRASGTGRVVLSGVRVPRTNLLGSSADYRDAVRRSRLAWAAAACGVAQAALDQLIPYVKERKAFGEPIAHRQAVAFTISDIGIELAALRLVVWKAAARLDAGKAAEKEIAQARALAATYGAQIGSNAVQMLGGHGFVKEFDNERWYRDLRATGLIDGGLLV